MYEDNYKVNIRMTLDTYGHSDSDFPDKNCSIEFDATDAHMSVVLSQFKDFLTLMGYVIDPHKRLELVDGE